MTDLKGLLFDKDGTLFDFAESWASVLDSVLSAFSDDPGLQSQMGHAIGYDREAKAFQPGSACVAGAVADIAQALAPHLPHLSVGQIEIIVNAAGESPEAAHGLSPAVPDLPGFTAGLVKAGYVLGVATHDSEAAARLHLAKVRCLDNFAFIAGYDSGHGWKPGPGMLLAFAQATGLDPSEIAMIGDSEHDLGVAPAAGAAMAIGVLTGPATREDLAPLADHVLDSIGDLPNLLGIRL
ncbi:MAG: HAD family hydrolase [Pseudomonadota bacterium]